MPLQKGFWRPQSQLFADNLTTKAFDIVIGLGISLFIYTILFYYHNKIHLRLMWFDYNFGSEHWLLSSKIQYLYNMIWAVIALTLGQILLVMIRTMSNKPNNYTHANRFENTYQRHKIIVLTYGKYLAFFGVLAFTLLWYFDSFRENLGYSLLAFIFLGVCYFTILQKIAKLVILSPQQLLQGFIITLMLSSLLAFYHPFDFTENQQKILKDSHSYVYDLDLPLVPFHCAAPRPQSLAIPLLIAETKHDLQMHESFNFPNFINLDTAKLSLYIEKQKVRLIEEQRLYQWAYLLIGQDIPMQKVFDLQEALKQQGLLKIAYAVFPNGVKNPHRLHYTDYALVKKLRAYCPDLTSKVQAIHSEQKFDVSSSDNEDCDFYTLNFYQANHQYAEKQKVIVRANHDITLNQKRIQPNQLYKELVSVISRNPNTLIYLDTEEATLYGDYMIAFSLIYKAYFDVWNAVSIKRFSKKYDDITLENRKAIRRDYPFLFLDRTPEEQILMDYLEDNFK